MVAILWRCVKMTSPTAPLGWPPEAIPRWLNRECAAYHCHMSPGYFDQQVAAQLLPQPHVTGRLTLYDRYELDEAMSKLPRRGEDDGEWPEPEV